jgi:hypothetical protein
VPDPRVASTGNFLVLAAVLLPLAAGLAASDVDVTAAGVAWAAVLVALGMWLAQGVSPRRRASAPGR